MILRLSRLAGLDSRKTPSSVTAGLTATRGLSFLGRSEQVMVVLDIKESVPAQRAEQDTCHCCVSATSLAVIHR